MEKICTWSCLIFLVNLIVHTCGHRYDFDLRTKPETSWTEGLTERADPRQYHEKRGQLLIVKPKRTTEFHFGKRSFKSLSSLEFLLRRLIKTLEAEEQNSQRKIRGSVHYFLKRPITEKKMRPWKPQTKTGNKILTNDDSKVLDTLKDYLESYLSTEGVDKGHDWELSLPVMYKPSEQGVRRKTDSQTFQVTSLKRRKREVRKSSSLLTTLKRFLHTMKNTSNINRKHSKVNPKLLFTQASDLFTQSPEINKRSPEMFKRSPEMYNRSPEMFKRSPEMFKRSPEMFKRSPEMFKRSPEMFKRSPEMFKRSPEMFKRSPEMFKRSPEMFKRSPEMFKRSPEMFKRSPEMFKRSPEMFKRSPEMFKRSPEMFKRSPEMFKRSPEMFKRSPEMFKRSPELFKRSPEMFKRSPELFKRSPEMFKRSPEMFKRLLMMITSGSAPSPKTSRMPLPHQYFSKKLKGMTSNIKKRDDFRNYMTDRDISGTWNLDPNAETVLDILMPNIGRETSDLSSFDFNPSSENPQ